MVTFVFAMTLMVLFGVSRGVITVLVRRHVGPYAQVARWVDLALIGLTSFVFPITLSWTAIVCFWQLCYLVLFGGTWLLITRR
ncbi:hypothetical protein [Levilactobacillus namurensis]|uniref:Uncharacterized protein n=1 Tax=Levilactobacillus namurensis TaxID=380393 RepID=A0AAW8W453_9LACO|nr:hypothetical protein [Levilactobacillus namurensis]MDT7013518.1 hypothetical protein [Levilactobacillus namurensis]HJE45990.1 hypothetical protein [Levilactobacillus namurensis]